MENFVKGRMRVGAIFFAGELSGGKGSRGDKGSKGTKNGAASGIARFRDVFPLLPLLPLPALLRLEPSSTPAAIGTRAKPDRLKPVLLLLDRGEGDGV